MAETIEMPGGGGGRPGPGLTWRGDGGGEREEEEEAGQHEEDRQEEGLPGVARHFVTHSRAGARNVVVVSGQTGGVEMTLDGCGLGGGVAAGFIVGPHRRWQLLAYA